MSPFEEGPQVTAAVEGVRRSDFLKRSAALGIGATTAGALLTAADHADAAEFPTGPARLLGRSGACELTSTAFRTW